MNRRMVWRPEGRMLMTKSSMAAKRESHALTLEPADGRQRVVIARVSPEIDGGRFAAKRVVGETVIVEADVFGDGHDQVACQILYCREGHEWQTSPMMPLGNDHWRGEFSVTNLGR